jgi:lysophospholipase L1-like esterase
MTFKRSGPFIAAVVFWLCAWSPAATAQSPNFRPPKRFIVALGDSLTFGFQQVRFAENPDPSNFNAGFVDRFTALTNQTPVGMHTQAVNFGCPGETTASLLAGPCAYHVVEGLGLHVNYSGAQIDAATSFIADNPGRVGVIIVDIGSNDLIALITACGGFGNIACIVAGAPAVTRTLVANYAEILTRLRAVAPQARILILQLYNPFGLIAPASDALLSSINDAIAAVAQEFGAFTANPFPGINLGPQPESICGLTQMCQSPPDIHLSDAGYIFAGNLLFQASGLDRFLRDP